MADDFLDNAQTIGPEDGLRAQPSLGDMTTAGAPTPDDALGKVDRYTLLEKLGQGGFGAVFRAYDEVTKTEVAVKALPPLVAHNPEELEGVRANFTLVERLSHPQIAALKHLHEVHQADAGAQGEAGLAPGDFLVVMEYVVGATLSRHARQYADGKMPVAEALGVGEDIAGALDFAHSEKVIHRDIKPSNIMLATGGKVKVLDFGLAAEVHSSLSRVSQQPSDTSGTRPYMAPEQWAGQEQGSAADQYALAALLYELLSGRVPFQGAFATNDPLVMRGAVETKFPEPLPQLTKQQNQALLKGLAKAPAERFGSCSELLGAMRGKGAGTRWPWWLAAALLGLLVVLIGIALLVHSPRPVRPDPPPASPDVPPVSTHLPTPVSVPTPPPPSTTGSPPATTTPPPVPNPGSVPAEPVRPAKPPQPTPGQAWAVPDPGLQFVWLEALGLWAGKHEITNEAYGKFRGHRIPAGKSGEKLDGARQPVVYVAYEDAVGFGEWLTKREREAGRLPDGLAYRLPSGEEWTALAQCGDGRIYPWGNSATPAYGNYSGDEAASANRLADYNDGARVTAAVEQSGANEWGLYGVGGNVWEFTTEKVGRSQVIRGGSWANSQRVTLRSSTKSECAPSYKDDKIGFRLVLGRQSSLKKNSLKKSSSY